MKEHIPYLKWKDYLVGRYGAALQRVPVDLGFGCPNRDERGQGGCVFCAEDGGRARQSAGIDEPSRQLEKGIAFVRRRYGARKFMLYIQAYTGTFAESDVFRRKLDDLLGLHPFDAVSIGTRPDCISGEIISYLEELNRTLDVWIELGVQSTHEKTLERVNRGHGWTCAEQAVLRVADSGLNAAVHLILGLPGEGLKEWCESAMRIAALPVRAVKLHNLHVIKGAPLAWEYEQAPFNLLDEHKYADGVIEILRRIPPDVAVMRLTTDTPDENLIAPRWSMTKGEFARFVEQRMFFRDAVQGDINGKNRVLRKASSFNPLPTDDGSITFWSDTFKEHYHSKVGAVTEARAKFIEPSFLLNRLAGRNVRLLDLCLGLGYNTIAACEEAETAKSGTLAVTAIELDIHVIRAAAGCLQSPGDSTLNWRDIPESLSEKRVWRGEFSSVKLLHGDARDLLDEAAEDAPYDIVFLDAFSTQRNAELWTVDFFRRLRDLMGTRGLLVTYCAAIPVRSGLIQAGFHVGETLPVGRKRGGTIAAVCKADIRQPLSPAELDLIRNSARGIPYRDPQQVWSNRRILKEREQERSKKDEL